MNKVVNKVPIIQTINAKIKRIEIWVEEWEKIL